VRGKKRKQQLYQIDMIMDVISHHTKQEKHRQLNKGHCSIAEGQELIETALISTSAHLRYIDRQYCSQYMYRRILQLVQSCL